MGYCVLQDLYGGLLLLGVDWFLHGFFVDLGEDACDCEVPVEVVQFVPDVLEEKRAMFGQVILEDHPEVDL